jgi:hypothetical protein
MSQRTLKRAVPLSSKIAPPNINKFVMPSPSMSRLARTRRHQSHINLIKRLQHKIDSKYPHMGSMKAIKRKEAQMRRKSMKMNEIKKLREYYARTGSWWITPSVKPSNKKYTRNFKAPERTNTDPL